MSSLKIKYQPREYQSTHSCYKKRITRRVKPRRKFMQKLKFLLFTFLALGIALPSVFKDVSNSLIVRRIQNAGINSPSVESLVFSSRQELQNDILFGSRFVDEVNIDKAQMKTPFYGKEMYILKSKLQKLASDYNNITPGIFVWDYMTGNYVSINGDSEVPTASIIKLPLLCHMFKRIEGGFLKLSDKIKLEEHYIAEGSGGLQYGELGSKWSINTLSRLMIQKSDNTATNMILAATGGTNEFNRSLRRWGFSQTNMKKWLPDLSGTNITTPRDMAQMLYNIDNPEFLTLPSRARIIDIMGHVRNRHLLQAGLPKQAKLLHKTGDIGNMLGDAGIVIMPNGRKYIVVAMVKRPWNSYSAKEFINKASKVIYTSFKSNDL